MSAHPTTPKPPRGPRRNPKRVTTTPISYPNTQRQRSPFENSRSSPPRGTPPSPSREGSLTYEPSANLSEGASKKKRGKKNKNNYAPVSPGPNGSINHRYSASQPMINTPPAAQESPRYAGPTFHASPAPSALPIPTFFSKSVPEADISQSAETEDESQDTEPGEYTPSKLRSAPVDPGEIGQPSPLDFLFKAARDARSISRASDGESRQGSPIPSRSQSCQVPQHADGAGGALFPFEFENFESKSMAIGPSFATPYKERMNALRSASSPSPLPGDRCLGEEQRKAKSDALKDLLINGRSLGHSLASPQHTHVFRSTSSTPQGGMYSALRHSSDPPTPFSVYLNGQRTPTKTPNGLPAKDSVPHQYLAALCNSAKSQRTPSSLCKELSPSSPVSPTRPQLERDQPLGSPIPYSNFSRNPGGHISPAPIHSISSLSSGPSPARGVPAKTDSADMRRMEEDLRRILKIDANNSHRLS